MIGYGHLGNRSFSDDTACDIRDEYRQQIEDGIDDAEALQATLTKFHGSFEDTERGGICMLALAVTQSKIGRLDPGIRRRAVAAIDSGADLVAWERDNPKLLPKRRAVLEKAKAQLLGPQPPRKRLRPPRRRTCGLAAGDGLALTTPSGLKLLRVVHVKTHRLGEIPILEEMQFEGSEAPSQEELDLLVSKDKASVGLRRDPRFFAFNGPDKAGWEQAGFRKVAFFAPRPHDEEAHVSTGIAWGAIARALRGEGQ